MKKLIPIAIAASLVLAGCASSGRSMSGGNAHDAMAAIKQAKHALKLAQAKDNVWLNTGKILKKAEAADKAGKYNEAVKLAGIATRQAQNAVAQADAQPNPGPRY